MPTFLVSLTTVGTIPQLCLGLRTIISVVKSIRGGVCDSLNCFKSAATESARWFVNVHPSPRRAFATEAPPDWAGAAVGQCSGHTNRRPHRDFRVEFAAALREYNDIVHT
jgi:hypothetical protein